jgi:hypothetical protein
MTAARVLRIISPRHENGSDWGVDTVVVAKKGAKELRWWPGHTSWMGVGSSGYYPANLITIDTADIHRSWSHIQEGGRLSSKTIQSKEKQIDAFLGRGAASLIAANWKRGVTVVLE